MKKRFFILLLVLIMTFSANSATAYASGGNTSAGSSDQETETKDIYNSGQEITTGAVYNSSQGIATAAVYNSSKAKPKPGSYKIIYKLNGGKNNPKNPKTYKRNARTITLRKPTKPGYTFVGWYRTKNFKKKITTIKRSSRGNITVYAKWTANNYCVSFKANRGSGSMASNMNCTYGKSYSLPNCTFTRDGYNFIGWNTAPDGSGTSFDNKARIKNLTQKKNGKVTLYAQWEYNSDTDYLGIKKDADTSNSVSFNIDDYKIIPNDGKDDTDAINEALGDASDQGVPIVVYLRSGTYDVSVEASGYTCAIKMRSNVTLKLAGDAVLRVKREPMKQCSGVIGFFNVQNSTVSGGKIIGTGDIGVGEDCYGIWVKSSKNVTIQNMEITGNQCDGIYLSPQQVTESYSIGNNGINIIGCRIHDNERNNISIVDADSVTIKGCNIYNPGERQPACGICVEPNRHDCSGDKICKDILIQETTISTGRSGNDWRYRTFYTYDNTDSGYHVAENVIIEHCTLTGYLGNYNGKNVQISKDTRINGTIDGQINRY